jgi:hypothetical protein
MNDNLERTWKEAVGAKFKVLSRHLPGGTEEKHETPRREKPVSESRFEPGTFRILEHDVQNAVAATKNTEWARACLSVASFMKYLQQLLGSHCCNNDMKYSC